MTTRTEVLGVMAAALVVGCVLYRPWVHAPFDLLDFSEFIPILAAAASPWDALGDLSRYYLGHGRVSSVIYALFVAKWYVFGDWTPGWQMARLALVTLVVAAAYLLYRKIGATRSGAALGSALFLVGPSASAGVVRLTSTEPLGTLLVLWAASLAIDARRGRAPRAASLQIGALTLLLGFTKEMMLVCLAIPIVLYLWPDGGWSRERVARVLRFLTPLLVAAAAVSITVVWGYRQTDSIGYAAEYGITRPALWELIPPWLFSFFPFDAFAGGAPVLFSGLMVAYLSVIVVGWRLFLDKADRETRQAARTFLLLAVAFPALLALAYLPWPVFNRFYYMPTAVTLGGLIAVAASGCARAGTAPRLVAVAAVVGAYTVGAAQARALSDRSLAARKAVGAMVRYAATLPVDTLFVGARIVANQQWQGLPETIQRYGPVVGVALPPVEGSPCAEGEAAAKDPTRRVAFIGFATACQAPRRSPGTVREDYRRFDFSSLRVVPDSVRIDVVHTPPSSR